MRTTIQLIVPAAALLLPAAMATADGELIDINIDEVVSWAELGNPNNTVLNIDINGGQATTVTGIAWDVTLTTIGGSWANEAAMYFDDNVNPDLTGLFLTPGFQTGSPVTGANYTSPILKLADVNIPDIVLPNGVLRIEFFENFVDDPAGPDAVWSGTLTIQATSVVPAPGAIALLGLGGLVGFRRRRR